MHGVNVALGMGRPWRCQQQLSSLRAHRTVELKLHIPSQTRAAIARGSENSCSSEFEIDSRTNVASGLSTLATVATQTRAAPERRRIRAHSETVVPVVKTSSTNRISRFWISAGASTLNAP